MEIPINTSKKHSITIEPGFFTRTEFPKGFVITDNNLAMEYFHLFDNKGYYRVHAIKPGEKSKSLETYSKILHELAEEVPSAIIAFGGGVVGDLAGYVASTCQRGLPLIQIPTSLMAMVDSSIGGKNGVNVGKIKNFAGRIYQPNHIFIDPDFLQTLPESEFENGLAEIIKYSYLFDSPSRNRLKKGVNKKDSDLTKIITESVRKKVRVVEEDEYDKDKRHVLNAGHTIGHGIELLYGLSHGIAISIGMVTEAKLGRSYKGIIFEREIKSLVEMLEANNLPTNLREVAGQYENIDVEKIIEIMKKDKKGAFNFAFSQEHTNVTLIEAQVRDFLEKEWN